MLFQAPRNPAALVAAALFLIIAGGAFNTALAQTAAPAAAAAPAGGLSYDPAQADRGKRIYTQNCARCHGLNMVSVGSAFFDLRTFPADEKPRFLDSVNNGKRVMPAWRDSLKPDEIEAIWACLNVNKPKPKR